MILYAVHRGVLRDNALSLNGLYERARMQLLMAADDTFKDYRLAINDIENAAMSGNIWHILANYQPYALVSYYYFKKFDFDKKLSKLFPSCKPILFADSGAFSAETQGAGINIDDYAQWIVKNQSHFLTYANFDVIGNEIQTAKNQEYLEKEYSLKPLPVFHVGASLKVLDRMMQRYDYIALGGLVPFRKNQVNLMKYFISCFKMARSNNTRFHGFGMTNWKLMKAFPWHSVDSSSWNKGAMFGRLSFFDMAKGNFITMELWDKVSVYKHARYLRALGFDPETFIYKDKYKREHACVLDGIAWALASIWLTQYWEQDLSIYLSVGEGSLPDISDINKLIKGKIA